MVFILGIIPARGGSKGIPNKNIITIGGKPLIAHTIEAAGKSSLLSDFILSTDSPKIVECAREYGLFCDCLRPADLASDDAKTIDVVLYELKQYETYNDVLVDIVVLLQPTTPLRTALDIENGIEQFCRQKPESLISVYNASFVHPSIMYILDGDRLSPFLEGANHPKRRQDYRQAFIRNGALYIASKSFIEEHHTFISEKPMAYIMPRERSINIDEPFDLLVAQYLLTKNNDDLL